MVAINKKAISKITERILADKNVSFPIDFSELLDKYENIDLFMTDAKVLWRDDVSWLVKKKEWRFEIYLYKDQPKTRLAFTFCHELGHIVLKHLENREMLVDQLHRKNNTHEARFFWWLTNEIDDEAIDEMEKEANYFATSLLMPEDEIKKMRLNTNKNIEKMSKHFKVSRESMSYRLIELKLFDLY